MKVSPLAFIGLKARAKERKKTTMKQLMKSAALLASVGAVLCFAGCNSVGDKPEDVVLTVLKKVQAGKADQAFLNKYCEEDTAKLFAAFGSKMTEALKGAMFTVAYSFVDDDVAVVKIKQEGGDRPGESYYDAKKIDGQWKVKINKEAHSDYYCGPSPKTITECVEAFKAAASKNSDAKYKDRCTKEFWDEMQEVAVKSKPEEFKEMQRAFSSIKIKGQKKSVLHDDAIEVELEMPGKNGMPTHNDLVIKIVDGKWKASKIQ